MPDLCSTESSISEKKLAANRANAKKSTGPKTTAGKERSRRNALKHGIRSERDLLPAELDAKVQGAFQKWKDQLRPEGEVETTLVRQAARCSCKLEWLDAQFNAVVTVQVRNAGYRFDSRERASARKEAEGLEENPAETVRLLRDSAAGCDRLIQDWRTLLAALPKGWDDDQTFLAVRLTGKDPAETLEPDLLSFSETRIQEIIAELEHRRAENEAEVDAALRAEAQAAALIPQGKWGALWPRYQGIVMKGYHQAIHDLIKIRRLDDPPRPNDFRRSGDDPPDGSNDSPRDRQTSMTAQDRAAAFAEAARQSEREKRKLERSIQDLSLQLEARNALIRRLERRGQAAPNEPTEAAKKTAATVKSARSPGFLRRIFRAAAILLVILTGAFSSSLRTIDAEDESAFPKRGESPSSDSAGRLNDLQTPPAGPRKPPQYRSQTPFPNPFDRDAGRTRR